LHIADKNNNDNMTPIFIGLNKTTQVILKQLPKLKICKIRKININKNHKHILDPTYYRKHGLRKKKIAQEKIKSDVLKQTYFNVNDETGRTLQYFNLRSNAM
jgi:hypothetical protein